MSCLCGTCSPSSSAVNRVAYDESDRLCVVPRSTANRLVGPMNRTARGRPCGMTPSKPTDPSEAPSTRRADGHDYGGFLGSRLNLKLRMPTTFVGPQRKVVGARGQATQADATIVREGRARKRSC